MNKFLIQQELRNRREIECFPIVNRGKLWYNMLSSEQLIELTDWYDAWLNCTETLVAPKPLKWVNKKIIDAEEIL